MVRAVFFCSWFLQTTVSAANDDPISRGKALIEKYACQSCHTIGKEGGAVGPNLNQVALRRSEPWLLNWLDNPSAVKPGTLMPQFAWAPGEREAVLAYLRQFAQPVDKAAILKREGPPAAAGEALIRAYQCFACHRVVSEPGRALYPDLTTVKERHDQAWEKDWLKDPQAMKPGTFMPQFNFSDDEIEAIVAFLYR